MGWIDRMTAINLEGQIVRSHYDAKTRVCSYTYQHSDGSRYTVTLPIDELQRLGNTPINKEQRRKHLAMKVLNHMHTHPPDHVAR
jgi:hypothetical protein